MSQKEQGTGGRKGQTDKRTDEQNAQCGYIRTAEHKSSRIIYLRLEPSCLLTKQSARPQEVYCF